MIKLSTTGMQTMQMIQARVMYARDVTPLTRDMPSVGMTMTSSMTLAMFLVHNAGGRQSLDKIFFSK